MCVRVSPVTTDCTGVGLCRRSSVHPVSGDCLFAATGVTTGPMLAGVKFEKDMILTDTVVMRSVTGTVRRITAEHRQLEKFYLD